MAGGVESNFKEIPFPSWGELRTQLSRTTRPTIAKRLLEVARGKIGRQQGSVRGKLSGQSVPGWLPGSFSHNLLKDGKIIRDRLRTVIEGQDVILGVGGNKRYSKIQHIHELGGRIPVSETKHPVFFLNGQFVHFKKETRFIVIPQRSYIRGTVYALEKWMENMILKAMKDSMVKLGSKRK